MLEGKCLLPVTGHRSFQLYTNVELEWLAGWLVDATRSYLFLSLVFCFSLDKSVMSPCFPCISFIQNRLNTKKSIFYHPPSALCWKTVAELFLEEAYRLGFFTVRRHWRSDLGSLSTTRCEDIFQVHGVILHAAESVCTLPLSCERLRGTWWISLLRNAGNVAIVIGNVCGMRRAASGR